LHITLFSKAFIVSARTQAGSAKIEAKDRNTCGIERLRCLVNDFIVERAAEERVWMANDCGECWLCGAYRGPENGLETPNRSIEKKRAGVVRSSHDKNARSECT
jgi:hypothetical protein